MEVHKTWGPKKLTTHNSNQEEPETLKSTLGHYKSCYYSCVFRLVKIVTYPMKFFSKNFFKFWCLSLIDWRWYKEWRIQRTSTKEEMDFQFLSNSRTLMTTNNSPAVFKNPSIILRGYRESASCNFLKQKLQKYTKWAQFLYRADHRTIKIA